jgi:peptidyl-prolyl cis-trans isomerase SurA
MMIKRTAILCLFVSVCLGVLVQPMAVSAAPMLETIAAVVNEDAITASDVNDRMDMIIVSSGLKNSDEIRKKLAPQIIEGLIEEQLQMQEARRLEITVPDDEIQMGLNTIAQQNNIPVEKFEEVLRQSRINIMTVRNQVRAQLSWNKVVQQKLRPSVNVTDSDIDDYLQRARSNIGKTEYLVAEIFLPVDDPKNEQPALQLTQNLIKEIRAGAPFSRVAQQFSKAAGAQQGGSLGWIQQGHLPDELDRVIVTMNKGDLSEPVRSLSGYHILLMRDQRLINEESIPQRDAVRNAIGLERLERQARRLMMELRAESFIEKRAAI